MCLFYYSFTPVYVFLLCPWIFFFVRYQYWCFSFLLDHICLISFHFLLKIFFSSLRICLLILERVGERERQKHWCEREISISCLTHALTRDELATWVCAPTRNWTSSILVCGWCSHPVTGPGRYFLMFNFSFSFL